MNKQIEFQKLYELIESALGDLAQVKCDNLFEQECHTCNAVDALNALSLKLLQMEKSLDNLTPLFHKDLSDLECDVIIKAAIAKDAERLRIAPGDVQTDIFRNRTLGRTIVRLSHDLKK